MPAHPDRRHFLQTAAIAGTAPGLGVWAGPGPLSPANAANRST
jgi:hypothetical protein